MTTPSGLSDSTLKDIEGLDAQEFGFCRGECENPPSSIPNSFDPLKTHLFISTKVPATEWSAKGNNAGYNPELLKGKEAAYPEAKCTLFYSDQEPHQLLVRNKNGVVCIEEYGNIGPDTLPLDAKGALVTDRSTAVYVFVCSHRTRDSRCGYCGPILVDLLSKSCDAQRPGHDVHVYPCSHVGGHTYAGNVIVYSSRGGVCFGCVKPADVDALAAYLLTPDAIPSQLEARVRGRMIV